jgi:hypothetical protein
LWLRRLESEEITMERATPILPADDLSVAKSFYVDRLGFSIRFEVSEDGKNGLLGLQRGTIYLTLDSPMSGHGREACVSLEVENGPGGSRDTEREHRGLGVLGMRERAQVVGAGAPGVPPLWGALRGRTGIEPSWRLNWPV